MVLNNTKYKCTETRKMVLGSSSATYCHLAKYSVLECHQVVVLCNSNSSSWACDYKQEYYWLASIILSAMEKRLAHSKSQNVALATCKRWSEHNKVFIALNIHLGVNRPSGGLRIQFKLC